MCKVKEEMNIISIWLKERLFQTVNLQEIPNLTDSDNDSDDDNNDDNENDINF